MIEVRISITTVWMVLVAQAVSAPIPQGYYVPPPPPQGYIPQPPFPPAFPPPPPNNMQYFPLPPPPPPPQMSLTDFSYQYHNTVNMPMPPLPPIGPNDLGKPMPLEAAAAAHAPAHSFGSAVEQEPVETGASANAINAPPQTSLLDSYYNGRPGSATDVTNNNMFGPLVGAYVMKEYLF